MVDTLYGIAVITSFIVSGAVVALNGIAALTKRDRKSVV